jgi:hypothetical protein
MENGIYCIANAIELNEKRKLFLCRGYNRLGMTIQLFIRETNSSLELHDKPTDMANEFQSKLVKCNNVIIKSICSKPVRCNFSRLDEWVECPYCGHSKLRALPAATN